MSIYTHIPSPIGDLLLVATKGSLSGLYLPTQTADIIIQPGWKLDQHANIFNLTAIQLKEYFSGTRKIFDISLFYEGTEFQKLVWTTLQGIPFGSTISYKELSTRINRPKAVRAVGQANGRNHIPIIIPCHRVIGSSGELTGYGGGIELKDALLRFEKRVLSNGPESFAY